MARGLGAVGARIGAVGARIGAVGARIGAVGARIGAVGARIGAVGARIGAVGALVLALTSSACLVGELQGVPCGSDDQCATAHFCDLTVGTCQAETDAASAPILDVTGIVDSNGDVVFSPFIDRVGAYDMAMVVENGGLLPAIAISVELSELACLDLVVDEANLPDTIVPGGQARIGFSMSPDGTCATPLVVDWFLLYSGRGSRGTFNININRADAGAN